MNDTITKSAVRRRLAAGLVTAAATVGVLTGCTVSGTASAPQAEVSAYKAAQLVKKQKSNALVECMTVPITMRRSVDAYNAMIAAMNSSGGNWDPNLTNKAIEGIDNDIKLLRNAQSKSLPDDLKAQMAKMITVRESQKAAILARNTSTLNASARDMNAERDRFRELCKTYIG